MTFNRRSARINGLVFALVLVLASLTGVARAQGYQNTITFVNQSGEDAVVKLVGPARFNVSVPNAANNSVRVPAGTYYILTRYCDAGGKCSYSKGAPFSVIQTETEYSDIEITLHKVVDGNYRTRDASAAEFNNQ